MQNLFPKQNVAFRQGQHYKPTPTRLLNNIGFTYFCCGCTLHHKICFHLVDDDRRSRRWIYRGPSWEVDEALSISAVDGDVEERQQQPKGNNVIYVHFDCDTKDGEGSDYWLLFQTASTVQSAFELFFCVGGTRGLNTFYRNQEDVLPNGSN